MFKKRLILCVLCCLPMAISAQTDVIIIDTTSSPAISSNYYIHAPGDAGAGINAGEPYAVSFGKKGNAHAASFTINHELYKQLISPDIVTYRKDGTNDSSYFWYEGKVTDQGSGFGIIEANASQMVSANSLSGILNSGIEDIFETRSDTGGQGSQRVKQMIDVVVQSGIATPLPEEAAITISKRGAEGDSVRVAVITSLDHQGLPKSYAPSVIIGREDWSKTNFSVSGHVVFRKESGSNGNDPPIAYYQDSDTLRAIAVSLADLHVSPDQVIYGYSIFPYGNDRASPFNFVPGGSAFISKRGLLSSDDDLFGNFLSLWLKADAGVVKGQGQAVRGWADFSPYGRIATAPGNAPQYVEGEDGMNFNPVISFNEKNREYFDLSRYAKDILTKDNTIFVVSKSNEGTGHNISFYATNFPPGPYTNGFGHSSADTLMELHTHHDHNGRSGVYFQNGDGNSSSTSRNTSNKPNITAVRYDRNKLELYDDGTMVSSATVPTGNYSPNYLFIGSHNDPREGSRLHDGIIAEVLVFRKELNTSDLNKIFTYLGIKYGITLNQEAYYYCASDGTALWKLFIPGFNNNIAGIGHDTGYKLSQKQSRSTQDGSIVTMGLNSIAVDNQSNTGVFAHDRSYLMWGNNKRSAERTNMVTRDIPTTVSSRMERIWLAREINNIGEVEVEFDLEDLGYDTSHEDFRLIVSDNYRRMVYGKTYPVAYKSGHKVVFKIDFTEEEQYFTLGIANEGPAPGGAGSALSLWLKADELEKDANNRVSHWPDMSGKGHHPTIVSSPKWLETRNAQSSVEFDKGNYLDLSDHAQEIFGNDALNKSVYIVTTNPAEGKGMMFYASDGMGAAYDGFGSQNWNLRESHIASNMTSSPLSTIGVFSQDNIGLGFNYREEIEEPGEQPLLITTLSQLFSNHKHMFISLGQNGITPANNGISNDFSNHPVEHLFIGRNGSPNTARWADGTQISEIIIFKDRYHHNAPGSVHPTAQSVMAYLALKYGITLNEKQPNHKKGADYRSANGIVTWPGYSDPLYTKYHNDVAGIGRDDYSSLRQEQSRSLGRGSIVTMGLGTIASNNPYSFDEDGSFLIWGHDTLPANASHINVADIPQGIKYRMARLWRVKKTGDVGKTTISFDNVNALGFTSPNVNDYRLIISDSENMLLGTVYAASSMEEGTLLFEDIDFTDGQYFTMAVAHNFSKSDLPLTISPNPVSGGDDLRIRSPFETFTSSKYYVVIKDLSGNEVYRQEVNAPTNEITVSTKGLPPGVYFISIISSGGKKSASKILVQ